MRSEFNPKNYYSEMLIWYHGAKMSFTTFSLERKCLNTLNWRFLLVSHVHSTNWHFKKYVFLFRPFFVIASLSFFFFFLNFLSSSSLSFHFPRSRSQIFERVKKKKLNNNNNNGGRIAISKIQACVFGRSICWKNKHHYSFHVR